MKLIKLAIYAAYRRCRILSVRFWSIFSKTTIIYEDSHRSKFLLEKNNALDFHISKNDSLDGGLPYKILELCEKESIAIDVGANSGYYTVPFARWFTEVHSFEPVAAIAEKLDKNVSLNFIKNVTLHKKACGQEDGLATLYVQDSIDGDFKINSGLSSTIKRKVYFKSETTVPLVKIDTLFDGYQVGIIKVDVEGAEYFVLNGAKEVIKQSCPTIIWEASVVISRSNISSCLKLLEDLNYKSYLVNNELIISTFVSADVSKLNFDSNVISLPSSRADFYEVQAKLLS